MKIPIEIGQENGWLLFRYLRVLWIVLAFSVFIWGLQYRLSFYSAHSAFSSRIPINKIFSQDDHPAADETAYSAEAPDDPGLLQAGLVLGILATLAAFRNRQLTATLTQTRNVLKFCDHQASFLRWSVSSFFRPPPPPFPFA